MRTSCNTRLVARALSPPGPRSLPAIRRRLQQASAILDHAWLPGSYLPRWTGYPFLVTVVGRTYDLVEGLTSLEVLKNYVDDFGVYVAHRWHLEALRSQGERLTRGAVQRYATQQPWSSTEIRRRADAMSAVLQISLLLNVPLEALRRSASRDAEPGGAWARPYPMSMVLRWGLGGFVAVEGLSWMVEWSRRRKDRLRSQGGRMECGPTPSTPSELDFGIAEEVPFDEEDFSIVEDVPDLDRVTVAPLSTTPSGDLMLPSITQVSRALCGSEQGQSPLTYRVIRKLGSGGMGRVELIDYEGQWRALKILNPMGQMGRVFQEIALKRFIREVRVMSGLGSHPHLIQILEPPGITPNGEPCYMMEYFHGTTLAAEQGQIFRLSMPERVRFVLQVAQQVLDALAYAHQRGVTHRDIKPSNIMFCQDKGQLFVKVVDLGIAKPTANEAARSYQLTLTDEVVGTYMYMAPERFSPEFGVADARSDLFSLGAVLHELLGGRHPFRDRLKEGTSSHFLATLLVIAKEPALSLPSDVPEFLQTAIHTALAKHPDDRFATAHAFAAALNVALRA